MAAPGTDLSRLVPVDRGRGYRGERPERTRSTAEWPVSWFQLCSGGADLPIEYVGHRTVDRLARRTLGNVDHWAALRFLCFAPACFDCPERVASVVDAPTDVVELESAN